MGFWTYVVTTLLGIVPGTFAYSLAGNGLDSVIEAQQAAHQSCLAKMGAGGQQVAGKKEHCSVVIKKAPCALEVQNPNQKICKGNKKMKVEGKEIIWGLELIIN